MALSSSSVLIKPMSYSSGLLISVSCSSELFTSLSFFATLCSILFLSSWLCSLLASPQYSAHCFLHAQTPLQLSALHHALPWSMRLLHCKQEPPDHSQLMHWQTLLYVVQTSRSHLCLSPLCHCLFSLAFAEDLFLDYLMLVEWLFLLLPAWEHNNLTAFPAFSLFSMVSAFYYSFNSLAQVVTCDSPWTQTDTPG